MARILKQVVYDAKQEALRLTRNAQSDIEALLQAGRQQAAAAQERACQESVEKESQRLAADKAQFEETYSAAIMQSQAEIQVLATAIVQKITGCAIAIESVATNVGGGTLQSFGITAQIDSQEN